MSGAWRMLETIREYALERLEESGEVETGLRLVGVLWWSWWVRGYLREGRSWQEQLLARTESAPSGTEAASPSVSAAVWAKALHGASVLAFRQGDYGRATAHAEQALALRRELGDIWGIAAALSCLGLAAQGQGDYARAAAFPERSLVLGRGR